MAVTACPTPWKVRHLSEDAALRQLRDMKKTLAQNKKLLNLLGLYACACGSWHVGHNKFKTARSARFAVARR